MNNKKFVPWNKGKIGIYSEETLLKMKKPKSEEVKIKISLSKLEKSKKRSLKLVKRFKFLIYNNFRKRQAFGEILGTIPSDGYFGLRDNRLYNYMLFSRDREFVERIANCFKEFDLEVKIHRRNTDSLWYIEICRRWFYVFLEFLMKDGKKWIFTNKTINFPHNDFKITLLRSFCDAEGSPICCIKDGKYFSRGISIYNQNKNLLSQLKKILSSFEINSYINLNREARIDKIKGYMQKFGPTYSLKITGQSDIKKFHGIVNFGILRKKEKLKSIVNSYRVRSYSVEDYNNVFSLFEKYKSYLKVGREMNINTKTVRDWVVCGRKPRDVKIYEGDKII